MSVASLLARPALRAPLVAVTIIATVATSPAGWMKSARTDARTVHLEAGGEASAVVDVDSSHVSTVNTRVEKLPTTGSLRIEAVDERAKCGTVATFASESGTWQAPSLPSNETQAFEVTEGCRGIRETQRTFGIRFENRGTDPIDFEWHVIARIGDEDRDSPPDGAFVTVELVE